MEDTIHKYCMSTNAITKSIILDRYKELLFLHVLSGSGYTSSFYHVGKVKFWNSWLVNQDEPEAFTRLGDCPSLPLKKEYINVIERFISFLYYDECNCFSIIWLSMKSESINKTWTLHLYPRQKML